jgi:hypothetical protein
MDHNSGELMFSPSAVKGKESENSNSSSSSSDSDEETGDY